MMESEVKKKKKKRERGRLRRSGREERKRNERVL